MPGACLMLIAHGMRNDERGTMNYELKTKAFQFIIQHSAFIIFSSPLWLNVSW
jgi:hypothetical protein